MRVCESSDSPGDSPGDSPRDSLRDSLNLVIIVMYKSYKRLPESTVVSENGIFISINSNFIAVNSIRYNRVGLYYYNTSV